MRPVAGEVLPDRELEPPERAERKPGRGDDRPARRRPSTKPAMISTIARKTVSSDSGKLPHGAGGRSSSDGLPRE